jgi:hypothetical protein
MAHDSQSDLSRLSIPRKEAPKQTDRFGTGSQRIWWLSRGPSLVMSDLTKLNGETCESNG